MTDVAASNGGDAEAAISVERECDGDVSMVRSGSDMEGTKPDSGARKGELGADERAFAVVVVVIDACFDNAREHSCSVLNISQPTGGVGCSLSCLAQRRYRC